MLRHWQLVAELEDLFKAGRVWPAGRPVPETPPPGWVADTIKSGKRKGHPTLRWTGEGDSAPAAAPKKKKATARSAPSRFASRSMPFKHPEGRDIHWEYHEAASKDHAAASRDAHAAGDHERTQLHNRAREAHDRMNAYLHADFARRHVARAAAQTAHGLSKRAWEAGEPAPVSEERHAALERERAEAGKIKREHTTAATHFKGLAERLRTAIGKQRGEGARRALREAEREAARAAQLHEAVARQPDDDQREKAHAQGRYAEAVAEWAMKGGRSRRPER